MALCCTGSVMSPRACFCEYYRQTKKLITIIIIIIVRVVQSDIIGYELCIITHPGVVSVQSQ